MPNMKQNKCKCSQNKNYIADNSQLSQHIHDGEPDPNIFSSLCHSSPGFTDKLLGIKPDLNPVVEKGKEGSQGEGCHKNGYKTKLKN